MGLKKIFLTLILLSVALYGDNGALADNAFGSSFENQGFLLLAKGVQLGFISTILRLIGVIIFIFGVKEILIEDRQGNTLSNVTIGLIMILVSIFLLSAPNLGKQYENQIKSNNKELEYWNVTE